MFVIKFFNIKILLLFFITVIGYSEIAFALEKEHVSNANITKDEDPLEEDISSYQKEIDYKALDPNEKFNRKLFALHKGLDKIILRPVAKIYDGVFPVFIKDRVHNFLQNLTEPVIFINGVLQLNPKKATDALARFLTNSTLGLGGIHDITKQMGLYHDDKGFESTLAHYKFVRGSYIFLPIYGPSSGRGLMGIAVDVVSDPFNYILRDNISFIRTGVHFVDERAAYLKLTDDIAQTAIDEYAMYRSLYFQRNK